jgi:hypothetical protein
MDPLGLSGSRVQSARKGGFGGASLVPPNRRGKLIVGLAGIFATLATASTASSQSATASSQPISEATKACVDAYGNAQELRKNNDLLKAREAMITCAGPTCPGIIQNDCTAWLGQVVDAIPSVVLVAKVDQEDVFDVSVAMDGKAIASQLDGKPIEINPGLHSFVFQRASGAPVEKKVIIPAHSKSQIVAVEWRSPAAARPVEGGPTPAGAEHSQEAAHQDLVRPVPAVVYVLGGVAVAAFGTFAVLGLTGNSTKQHLESTCGPTHTCSQSDVSSLETRFVIADVAVGVGAVAAVSALTVFLLRPAHAAHPLAVTAPSSAVMALGVAPTAGGAALEWTGSF